jgi:hypothetical protein
MDKYYMHFNTKRFTCDANPNLTNYEVHHG